MNSCKKCKQPNDNENDELCDSCVEEESSSEAYETAMFGSDG